MHTHPYSEPREGRHCYPYDPYDIDGIAEEIDRQETQRAIECIRRDYPDMLDRPFVPRVSTGMAR